MKPVSVTYKYSGASHARAQTTQTVNAEAVSESAVIAALKKLCPQRKDIVIIAMKQIGK